MVRLISCSSLRIFSHSLLLLTTSYVHTPILALSHRYADVHCTGFILTRTRIDHVASPNGVDLFCNVVVARSKRRDDVEFTSMVVIRLVKQNKSAIVLCVLIYIPLWFTVGIFKSSEKSDQSQVSQTFAEMRTHTHRRRAILLCI